MRKKENVKTLKDLAFIRLKGLPHSTKKITGYKQSSIEHNKLTEWNWMVGHPEGLNLGKKVDIGAFTYINARFGVDIGNNVQIGGGCHIYSYNSINNTSGKVIIKDSAKIGAHCVILPGVIIGKGRIVKAGSIITWANNNMSLDKNDIKKI